MVHKPEDEFDWLLTLLVSIYFIGLAAFFGLIIYIVTHFILKYW